ncbi:MAG TPA: HypC/HybG/HupF family hydrogenase formation chaperone [Minicystis sp.]|nr:HypC/HybG/HupF family hydrogenase formation chaperone [Minicystis sp.]
MCLGIPGRVLDRSLEHGLAMGRVDFGGVVKRVCLEHVPEAAVGDYVLVHVGFALTRLDPAEAEQALAMLEQAAVDAELAGDEGAS